MPARTVHVGIGLNNNLSRFIDQLLFITCMRVITCKTQTIVMSAGYYFTPNIDR